MHRKPLAALAAALSVLALAGIAFAHGGSPSSIQATSATFMATTVADSKSDTCTGTDGTYTRTRARYTGMATSTDARLSGSDTSPPPQQPSVPCTRRLLPAIPLRIFLSLISPLKLDFLNP